MVSNSISQDVNFPDLLMDPVTGQLFAFTSRDLAGRRKGR
jgi:hypothetical protein